MSDDTARDDRLLFCPFCRECYEGQAQCPEHELDLVEFHMLPKQAHERDAVGPDDPVMPWDPRFGRLWIALGGVAALVGFFAMPMAVGTFDGQAVSWTGFDVASSRAPNLWTVPFAAALFVVFLYRRRTPLEMRGARLAGVLLSLMPAVSLGYSMWNVRRAVEAAHGAIALEWSSGVWVIAASSALLFAGSVRFGALPRGALPHGAGPDDDEPRIDAGRPRRRR